MKHTKTSSKESAKVPSGGRRTANKNPNQKPKKRTQPAAPRAVDFFTCELLYGSSTNDRNDTLLDRAPLAIDYRTLEETRIPEDWGSKQRSKSACKGIDNFARLAGHIAFTLHDITHAMLAGLVQEQSVLTEAGFNMDGEFSTPHGQIPISRLMDHLPDDQVLHAVYALQSPQSSAWNQPFIRCISNHTFSKSTLKVKIYVYFIRTIFELIADPAIKILMDNVKGCTVNRVPVTTPSKQPQMFLKASAVDNVLHQYSLAGLLKQAESTGYTSKRKYDRQPKGLAVDLYDFQKSSLDWMIDQEMLEGGLNGRFWEELQYSDGGPYMYYFPLAGEFRLAKPPLMTGGLLCEEMGLGKTVICIALILSNPSSIEVGKFIGEGSDNDELENEGEDGLVLLKPLRAGFKAKAATRKISSNTTLIVVPTTLVGQWWRELHQRVKLDVHPLLMLNASDLSINTLTIPLANCRWVKNDASAKNSKEKVRGRSQDTVLTYDWGMGFNEMLSQDKYQKFFYEEKQEIYYPPHVRRLPQYRAPRYEDSPMPIDEWQEFIQPLLDLIPDRGDTIEVRNLPGFPAGMAFVLPVGGTMKAQSALQATPSYLRNSTDFQRHLKGQLEQEPVTVQINLETLCHLYMHKMDVVITSYDTLRQARSSYSRIHFHRIILDECQEIKSTTAQIASICADLGSNHRWMVSGTPLCSNIEDLHGELNFLKVWPFSLANNQDGFWNAKIGGPFRERNPNGLSLLHALINNVMMRHSKSMRYLDGRPLVKMPPRTIEWRPVTLNQAAEKYLYNWLECFACDSIDRYFLNNDEDEGNVEAAHNNIWGMMQPHIRNLVPIMSKLLTHPSCVNLESLDRIRRLINSDIAFLAQDAPKDGQLITKLTAQEILAIVQSGAANETGGVALNYDTSGRIIASVSQQKVEEEFRKQHDELSVAELKDLVEKADLPVPMSWSVLPLWVSVDIDSKSLRVHRNLQRPNTENPEPWNESNLEGIQPNDFLKVSAYNKTPEEQTESKLRKKQEKKENARKQQEKKDMRRRGIIEEPVENAPKLPKWPEHEVHVLRVRKDASEHSPVWRVQKPPKEPEIVHAYIDIALKWPLPNRTCATISRFQHSSNKKSYVDLLLSKHLKQHCNKEAGAALHEQGFETLYKIIAQNEVECPICMDNCTRPVISRCIHASCYTCIVQMLQDHNQNRPAAQQRAGAGKCPVCRREICFATLMEVADDAEVASGDESSESSFEEENVDDEWDPMEEKASGNVKAKKRSTVKEPPSKVQKRCAASTSFVAKDSTKRSVDFEPSNSLEENGASNKKRRANTHDDSATKTNAVLLKPASLLPKSNDAEEDTRFLVPELNDHRDHGGAVQHDVNSIQLPFIISLPERSRQLPSLEPLILHLFSDWSRQPQRQDLWMLNAHQHNFPISSKMRALLDDMAEVRREDPFAKFVIFSKFAESLHSVKDMFALINRNEPEAYGTQPFRCAIVTEGAKHLKEAALQQFNDDPETNVCLLHIASCGTGLTLTIASCLYMLEPEENAALEAQVMNRVHRIGQLKKVRCVVFYGKDTWEERLLHHRQSQGSLTEILANPDALSVLSGPADDEKDVKKAGRGGTGVAAPKEKKWTAELLKALLGVNPARSERKKITDKLCAARSSNSGVGRATAIFANNEIIPAPAANLGSRVQDVAPRGGRVLRNWMDSGSDDDEDYDDDDDDAVSDEGMEEFLLGFAQRTGEAALIPADDARRARAPSARPNLPGSYTYRSVLAAPIRVGRRSRAVPVSHTARAAAAAAALSSSSTPGASTGASTSNNLAYRVEEENGMEIVIID